MEPSPQLITERLLLRKIKLEDAPVLIKYCNNKKISDQILNIPFPYGEEEAVFRMNFIFQGLKNKDRYVFAITLKEKDELIGEIGLHLDKANDSAQFGYWVAEPFWCMGIATEATAALLKFGFGLGLNKIYATHYVDNPASGHVMIKNKMIKEAELKEHIKPGEVYKSVIQYRLTKAEYESVFAEPGR